MHSVSRESLKEEARRHEQNEQWPKALDLYLQAIDAQAEGEEPDIALHNRVGDLQIRLRDADGTVATYERGWRRIPGTPRAGSSSAGHSCRPGTRRGPRIKKPP